MKPKTTTELARLYTVTTRTIRRWRNAGAPFGDPKAMTKWLASNKNLPPNLTADSTDTKPDTALPSVSASAEPTTPPARGATAALGRLEQAEAAAFTALERAIETSDLLAIRPARKAWLDTALCLARFDRQVELFRRDTGAVVEKAEVEKCLKMLAHFWHCAVLDSATNLSGSTQGNESLPERRAAIVDSLSTGFWHALAGLMGRIGTPPWILTALRGQQRSVYRHADPCIDALAKDFAAWIQSGRTNVVLEVAALRAELTRLEAKLEKERAQDEQSAVWHSTAFLEARAAFVETIKQGKATWVDLSRWETDYAARNRPESNAS